MGTIFFSHTPHRYRGLRTPSYTPCLGSPLPSTPSRTSIHSAVFAQHKHDRRTGTPGFGLNHQYRIQGYRQDLHEVRCSVIRCRRSVGVESAAASHPCPPVGRLLQGFALKTYLFDCSWLNTHCCRDNATVVNRMVDARPCNVFVVLRRISNSRTIIIISYVAKKVSLMP